MGKQAKKIKLQLPDTYCLLAIYSISSDYHLAWLLNVALGVSMQREEQPDEQQCFSLYSDRNSLAPVQFLLIRNKAECRRLFPQYEQVDYFFKISNIAEEQIPEFINKIRAIEDVTTCAQLKKDVKLLRMLNRL